MFCYTLIKNMCVCVCVCVFLWDKVPYCTSSENVNSYLIYLALVVFDRFFIYNFIVLWDSLKIPESAKLPPGCENSWIHKELTSVSSTDISWIRKRRAKSQESEAGYSITIVIFIYTCAFPTVKNAWLTQSPLGFPSP